MRMLWPSEFPGVCDAYENKWGGLQAVAVFRDELNTPWKVIVGHASMALRSGEFLVKPGDFWLDGGDTGSQTTGPHWHLSLFRGSGTDKIKWTRVDPKPFMVFDQPSGPGYMRSYHGRSHPKVIAVVERPGKWPEVHLPEEISGIFRRANESEETRRKANGDYWQWRAGGGWYPAFGDDEDCRPGG